MTPAAIRELATYVLPLKCQKPADQELVDYLRRLSALLPVVVVDGSAAPVFDAHSRMWGSFVRHIAVSSQAANGKVAGVVDGVATAMTPYVVIADDDIRYDEAALTAVISPLAEHAAVVPQNYFRPLPWHAQWDSARSLINRALGHDYAGTTAVRRQAFLDSAGYCGAVLFENLELLRTLNASGHRIAHVDDVFVCRRPPAFRHFVGQRVRQAFDSTAQPHRLAVELAVLPILFLAAMRRPRRLAAGALMAVSLAEVGRRRHGGRSVFPAFLPLWAPGWVLERSVCAWLAMAARTRGGVRYAGQRLSVSAHPARILRPPACPEHATGRRCRCDTALRPRALEQVAA